MMKTAAKKRYDNKGRVLEKGISQRAADGRYQIRITKDGHQIVRYSWDFNEAKQIQREMRYDIDQGYRTDLRRYTLSEYFDSWISTFKEAELKPKVMQYYKEYFNNTVRHGSLGKMPIDKISQRVLINYLNQLRTRKGEEYAKTTLCYILGIISQELKCAQMEGLITKNPAIGIRKFIKGKEPVKRNGLEIWEENAFMNVVRNSNYDIYEPLYTVFLQTGLRLGELGGLTWEDIDFESRFITVNKSLCYNRIEEGVGRSFFLTTPKTRTSIREVPMTNEVLEALRRQKQYQKNLNITGSCSVPFYNDRKEIVKRCHNFVFTTSVGTNFTPEAINRTIKLIVKLYNTNEIKTAGTEQREAKTLRNFSVHVFRHTFASRAYEKHMDIRTVAKVMGHSKINVTAEVYTHVHNDQMKEDMLKAWDSE